MPSATSNSVRPSGDPALLAQGLEHHRAGRLDEAEQIYRQMLKADANDIQALQLMGTLALQRRDHVGAGEFLSRTLAVNPNNAEARINLGLALFGSGNAEEAVSQYRAALEINPRQALAYNHMGLALVRLGRGEEALGAHRQAVALDPNDENARYNLGLALEKQRRYDEAIEEYDRALAMRPKFVEAMHNRGTALTARAEPGDTQAAIAAFEQALSWRPNYAPALSNLGIALADVGRLEEAIASARRAIAVGPATPTMHWHLALATLKSGDLQQGFREYEWRWQTAEVQFPARHFTQPHWDGSELGSRRLLLYAEQGVGDMVQFVRYVSMLADFGGAIILEGHPFLYRLLSGIPGIHQIVPHGQLLPEFDVHCALMTLPLLFGTTMQTIPAEIPYLRPEAALVRQWRERLGQIKGIKVGINWAGNPHFRDDRRRSTKLATFAPVAAVAGDRGMTLISLRKAFNEGGGGALGGALGGAFRGALGGDAGRDTGVVAEPVDGEIDLVSFTDDLKDFADTAALIANLDLVISTDTAVVHLAGALGKPVWTLLSTTCDWRWFTNREDSPWYPTMRLFRQDQPGDWSAPVARMAEALRGFEPGGGR
jgi:tetratricopeptide (TPR) repeat protein